MRFYSDKIITRNNLSSLIIALTAFAIPFSIGLLPYLIGLSFVSVFFQTNLKDKLKSAFNSRFLIIIYAFYAIHLIGLLYSTNISDGFFNVQVKASLLVLPLVIFTSYQSVNRNIKVILHGFIAGNAVAAVYCIINAFLNSYSGGFFSPLNTEQPEIWSYSKVLFSGYSYFNYSNLSSLIHVNYYSMYILLVLYILYHQLVRKEDILNPKLRFLYIVLLIFFSLFFFLLQSRAALLALIVILLFEFVYHFRRPDRLKIKLVVLVTSLVVLTLIIGTSDRIQRIYQGTSVPTYSEIKESEIRLALWEMSIPIIKAHPIFGIGTGDVDEEYNKNYNLELLEHSDGKYLNVHNEYLHTAMRLGIPTMFFLLFIVCYPLGYKTALREHRYIFAFTIIILVSFIFESVLNRLNGVVFFAIFYSLFGVILTQYKRNQLNSNQ